MANCEDVRRAFRLDMQRMAHDGELWRWPELVKLAEKNLQEFPDSCLKLIYEELVAMDVLCTFIGDMRIARDQQQR